MYLHDGDVDASILRDFSFPGNLEDVESFSTLSPLRDTIDKDIQERILVRKRESEK